ncbi:MAG: PEP-CTERM sorting domain-containing protein [Myxococcota bacterium]
MERIRLALGAALAAGLLLAPAPSMATGIVLDGVGDSGMIDGAYFTAIGSLTSAGTGQFDSFVRIQHGGMDPQFEAGFNTDGAVELETKSGPWTRSIQLSEIPLLAYEGTTYYEFLFDSNEVGGENSSIQIDDIQIFLGGAGDLTGYDGSANTLAGLSAVYRLDDGDDHTILLNANFNGSGRGEVQFLLPTTSVGGDPGDFLYFYSEYSLAGDGFEEWGLRVGGAVPPPAPAVPEPQTLLLMIAGLAGLTYQARRPS